MRHETILKRLKEIRDEKDGHKAFKKLNRLIEALEYKIQQEKERKEKYGKAIQHLVGWYLKAWNQKPPESFGRTNYQAVIGKTFRELLIIYENNGLSADDIKKEYQAFMEGHGIQNFLLGDKSITRFKQVLPQLKQLESKGKKVKKKWVSEQFLHSDDTYGKSVIDADQLVEDDLSIPNVSDDEDVPF